MYKHSRKNSAGLSGNFTKLMCLRTFKWNIKTLNETKSSPKNRTTSLPQGVLSADYSNTLGRKIFVDIKFSLYSRLDTSLLHSQHLQKRVNLLIHCNGASTNIFDSQHFPLYSTTTRQTTYSYRLMRSWITLLCSFILHFACEMISFILQGDKC